MVDIQQWSKDKWADKRFVIGRLGPRSLDWPIELNSDQTIVVGTQNRYFTARDNYELLALLRAVEFQGQGREAANELVASSQSPSAERLSTRNDAWQKLRTSDSVVFGFLVCGRLLGYAPLAYERFCQTQNTVPSVEELGSIAGHPNSFEQTAKYLALMKNVPDNKAWERAAQLHNGQYKSDPGFTPLRVMPAADSTVSLTIDPVIRMQAALDIGDKDEKAASVVDGCPAASVFLPKLWSKLVEDCVSIPELFHADIAAMTQTATAG